MRLGRGALSEGRLAVRRRGDRRVTQADHDQLHPGKICRTCPSQLEQYERMRRVGDPWWEPVFILAMAVALVWVAVVLAKAVL